MRCYSLCTPVVNVWISHAAGLCTTTALKQCSPGEGRGTVTQGQKRRLSVQAFERSCRVYAAREDEGWVVSQARVSAVPLLANNLVVEATLLYHCALPTDGQQRAR